MNNKLKRNIGIIMIACGVSVLSLMAYRKISREIYLRRLLKDNIVFEVPRLDIRVPVLEGTDSKSLQVSAGHFEGTGALGHGNYCIAGHNSTIYAEIFNDLDNIRTGDEMYLVDIDDKRTKYEYIVDEYKVVEPNEVEVLKDFGDDRLTVISCTDDGKQRQVVVGKLKK
ncbi:MAG: class D sortase [Ruminococcus sp.]|uniref:class D sortase n=1 Tax=Ruminococcus sp. TaxID=41978 RepID=UPI0025E4B5E4|nr:class D sortase [Ruminococcus sp.]MCR5600126.1 class D sortase [Ruminococcus sp.]